MTSIKALRFRTLLAALAVTAAIPLAGCNQPSSRSAYDLPDLPATLPLAVGEPSALRYAPAVAELPHARPIEAVRVADPGQYYAYAEDAWGFDDALGYAPPDYGFDYDDVEPWAWQGYDDSMMFVEPLEYGYRAYYYRPGDDAPYFIRDPDCGYGYDHGRLAVVYASDGAIIPYDRYGPRLGYASRYYERGRDLYQASRRRHPVIAYDWLSRRDAIGAARGDWVRQSERQPAWQDYRRRNVQRQDAHWNEERARRRADMVRFASWQQQDFRTPPPPRAIPADWTRAAWARDERRYAPPARGFDGDAAARARAADRERVRFAAQSSRAAAEQRQALRQDRIASVRQDAAGQRESGRREREARFVEAGDLAARQRTDQAQFRRDRQQARQQQLTEVRDERPRRDEQAARREAAEQHRLAQAELQQRRQVQARDEARVQRRADAEPHRASQVRAQQQQQAQIQARGETDRLRQDQVRARAEAEQRRQDRGQARAEADRRRQDQVRVRAEAEQRRQDQGRARAESEQRREADRAQAQARRQEQAQAAGQAQRAGRSEARPQAQAPAQRQVQAPAQRQVQADDRGQDRAKARQARQVAREERRNERRQP